MFDQLKKIFTPPYSSKDLYSIFISLFIMLAIPLTVLQITSVRDTRTSASTKDAGSFKVLLQLQQKEYESVSGVVKINAEAASENSSVVSISLLADGETVITAKNQSKTNKFSASFDWDTTKIRDGLKSVQAVALNSGGSKAYSTSYNLFVNNNDTQKPTLSFIRPQDKTIIKSSSYKIVLTADDNSVLENVSLSIDGTVVKTFNEVPYEYNWNLAKVAPGNHTLEAVAQDISGNSTSVSIQIYKSVHSP